MVKPKIFIFDTKETLEVYEVLLDLFEIEVKGTPPESINGISGIILHSPPMESLSILKLIKQAKKKNLPLIIQSSFALPLRSAEDFLNDPSRKDYNYNNVHYTTSNEERFRNLLKKLVYTS